VSGFGEASARLCGAAAMLLGWRPDEFWNATPAELALALRAPDEPSELTTVAELRELFPDEWKA
jgi:hypothetical protein